MAVEPRYKQRSTDINGAEVWVKFDENGESNFSNLKFVEDKAGQRVNFKYDSVEFTLRDSVVHFGDVFPAIFRVMPDVLFLLSPDKRYRSRKTNKKDISLT